MTFAGHRSVFAAICLALLASSSFAQQQPPPSDDRMQQLEKKLDELLRQAAEIRQQLDAMKGTQPAPPPAEAQAAPVEDLTKIDVPTATAPAPVPATSTETASKEAPPPALTDIQPVANASNPGAGKVFNPDISVIGNFIGKAGQRNPWELPGDLRAPAALDEAEVAFEAFVDPYAKAKFFLSAGPNGLDIEEGYAQFVNLPKDITAKVGKMKATFGKANTWHTHVRPWVDQPLVIHNFFGDEQLHDSGVSVSRPFDNPWNTYLEATGEVFSGSVDNVFERSQQNDLFYNAHFKAFKDLTENTNLEVGTSYARGTFDNATNQFGGVDVTVRWKPLQQGLYRGFVGRFEGIVNDRPNVAKNLKGFYASGDYQLGQRWFTGVRIDSADRFALPDAVNAGAIAGDRGISATLTFWPSEFSLLRGQLRRTHYGLEQRSATELLFQLQFAIGAHGAHSF